MNNSVMKKWLWQHLKVFILVPKKLELEEIFHIAIEECYEMSNQARKFKKLIISK